MYDLADGRAVTVALAVTRAEQSRPRDGERLADAFVADWRGRAFVAFCLFTVFFVGLVASRAVPPGWTLVIAAGAAVVTTAAMVIGRSGERFTEAAASLPVGVQILSPARNEPDIAPGAERTVVRGVVRASRTISSVLDGRECVAFRLVGDGVSDGAFTRFEIDVDGGGRAIVDGEHASVALATGPAVLHPANPRLRAFLRERFVFRNPAALPLAEATLADGDRVEVEGSWTSTPEPELYRDVAWVKVFREEPGSPLIIRASDPA